MKIISKLNCKRCEEIKSYLNINKINFEEEMAEDKGYEYWRNLVQEKTGKIGFPILIKGEHLENGSSEEIINYLTSLNEITENKYTWGI
jgi:glutaredoxin